MTFHPTSATVSLYVLNYLDTSNKVLNGVLEKRDIFTQTHPALVFTT